MKQIINFLLIVFVKSCLIIQGNIEDENNDK